MSSLLSPTISSVLSRAHQPLLLAAGIYALGLVLVTFEPVQRSLLYLHWVKFPFFADFDSPERYGYAPGKVRNFYLETSDGARIGAWHVLPNSVYEQSILEIGSISAVLPESVFDMALRTAPTVLYFHGNAATRAASNRVRVGRYMSAENRNFIVIDYRGFADSTGVPTERGLYLDARRFWDWLTLENGVKAENISVMGQSLGTGVTASLVSTLACEGISPKSMILVAPFSSIPRLLKTYKLGMIIPVLGPLKSFPTLVDTFLKSLYTRFDTIGVISMIKCPILLLHAQNDATIPYTHSQDLFEHMISLESNEAKTTTQEWGNWGAVNQLDRADGGRVILGAAMSGNHNNIGSEEMSLRLMNEIMK